VDLPAPGHRIWSHALAATVVMVSVPTLAATIAWYVNPSWRDIDMDGVHELILTFVMFLSLPALILSFGILAPSAIALDRVARGRTSRAANLLFGSVLAVPALAVFLIGGAFLRSGPHLDAFVEGFKRPGSVAVHQPVRALVLLALFALAGIIVALGMRHRGRARS
jgi:hypothetical protein